MKSFNKTLIPLLALLLGFTLPLSAQQEQSKDDQKVIIITKTIDDDGNEVVKRIVKKGDEANEYLDNNQILIDTDNPDIVDVRVMKNCDKNQFIIDADDMGDSRDFHFDINVDEDDGQKRIRIKGIDENGEAFDIDWEGEGEIPAEIQEKMHHRQHGMRKHWGHHGGEKHGFLGVVMGEKVENINGEETVTGKSPLGVVINKIVEGSGAEAAGLQANDIITSINGQSLKNSDQLSREIKKHKAGDEIKVNYLRDGQAGEAMATLQGRHTGRSHSFEWHDDFNESFHFKGDHLDFRPAPCRPFIGVYLNLGDNESNGVSVQRIIPNTPADEVQLQKGDLITAIDDIVVGSHGELVVERDKHAPGDKFTLTYLRDGVSKTVNAMFPSCDEQRNVGKNRVIIIQKSGDKETMEILEDGENSAEKANPFTVPESNLVLNNFQAYPNPTEGLTTVRFESEAGPAVLTVNDIAGKEIYREELNNFDGIYNRQLDLSDAAPGTLLLSIRQDDRIFTDKIILRKDN